MNEFAQTALIAAIGGGLYIRRLKAATEGAANLAVREKSIRTGETLAANGAKAVGHGTDRRKTVITDGQT
jgi:hypothetical protein